MTILSLTGVVKDYHGLRPLRINRLTIDAGEQVALLGIDEPVAETLVNLLTGATLPEQGEIEVFGKSTREIQDSTEWLAVVDRFGIVSDRAVLLDGLSIVQNLAVPYSLDIEPPPEDVRKQAVAMAEEVGLPAVEWERRVAEVGASSRVRVRLGRALALNPAIVLLEHPSRSLLRQEVVPFGREVRRVVEKRGAASLTLSADAEFAGALASRVLTLQAATGELLAPRRGWFGRRP